MTAALGERPLLVFQHVACEHPGIFREFLAADGIGWQAVELDAGEPIPDLSGYSALWVMGGPMDTWQEAEHPWLADEKRAIREAVIDRGLPFFGLCLGHQLLADALGGEVAPGEPEVGVMTVSATPEARESPFLRGLPQTLTALQWHGAEVTRVPDSARVLMESPACAVQAMSVGDRAFSVQFHVELTPSTVSDWAEVPAYRRSLESTLGAGALGDLEQRLASHMEDFNAVSRRLYENWTAAVTGG